MLWVGSKRTSGKGWKKTVQVGIVEEEKKKGGELLVSREKKRRMSFCLATGGGEGKERREQKLRKNAGGILKTSWELGGRKGVEIHALKPRARGKKKNGQKKTKRENMTCKKYKRGEGKKNEICPEPMEKKKKKNIGKRKRGRGWGGESFPRTDLKGGKPKKPSYNVWERIEKGKWGGKVYINRRKKGRKSGREGGKRSPAIKESKTLPEGERSEEVTWITGGKKRRSNRPVKAGKSEGGVKNI